MRWSTANCVVRFDRTAHCLASVQALFCTCSETRTCACQKVLKSQRLGIRVTAKRAVVAEWTAVSHPRCHACIVQQDTERNKSASLRRQSVIVTNADLLDSNGVILVDNGDGVICQQLMEGVPCI